MIFVGITLFFISSMAYKNMQNSLEKYYDEYKFLDYFAEVKDLNVEMIERVKSIDGVKEAIGRYSIDVRADINKNKKIVFRVITIPDNKRPTINNLYGDYFTDNKLNKCLLSSSVAKHHNLNKDSEIIINYNNKKYKLKVDNIVASPEYIFEIRSKADGAPSLDDFGIMYIKESTSEKIFKNYNKYNQLHVLFDEGAKRRQVISEIKNMLSPYGFTNGVERENQLSNKAVNIQLNQIRDISYMFPLLFLFVAAIVIYIMQKKLILNQRTIKVL